MFIDLLVTCVKLVSNVLYLAYSLLELVVYRQLVSNIIIVYTA